MAKQKANEVKEFRSRVESLFGAQLAKKASDEFCQTYGRVTFPMAGLEFATAVAFAPPSIVLEFAPQANVFDAIQSSIAALRSSAAWAQMSEALAKLVVPAVSLSGLVTEVMESGRSEPELLPLKNLPILRYIQATTLRDNFMKAASPITDDIERRVHGLAGPGLERAAATAPRSVTQVCWLNRTARARVDPRALSDIANDDSVAKIDVTRRIEPELMRMPTTVGVPNFRTDTGFMGKGIIVAVIDSEVALSHPALKGRVVHKENYTNELWGNTGSHGTAVAGIIASNDATFTGMAPEVTIYNYKVIAENPFLSGDDFDGALALQQALEDGAHVANCSWGNGPAGNGSSREARACNAAWALGMTIVKSAGNRGPGSSTLTTPAEATGVIAVGATNREGDAVQDYSSRGPAQTGPRPHLLAPGGIVGGIGITSCLPGGGFGDCGAGTSFAAPHVSGLVALLLDQDPNRLPDDCRTMLLSNCQPLPNVGQNIQGSGLVTL